MNKEEWDKLHYKEKDKLIEEKLTHKPGNYSRDWNAAMWLIKFMVDHKPERLYAFDYDLFEDHGIGITRSWMASVASWTPDEVCYIALCTLDQEPYDGE